MRASPRRRSSSPRHGPALSSGPDHMRSVAARSPEARSADERRSATSVRYCFQQAGMVAVRGTANWYSTWLEDSDGQSIIVNSLQSRGAGSADAVLGAVDLVTPGTIGRFGNPNTNSIYAYSDDIGQWVGPQILIGGNAGNAAKATSYVGNVGERVLAEAAASLSARAAFETAANSAGRVADDAVELFRRSEFGSLTL